MNYEVDDLLDMVDKWKFKLHEKLQKMTPVEEAAFWKRSTDKARAAGLSVAEPDMPPKRRAQRRRRATG